MKSDSCTLFLHLISIREQCAANQLPLQLFRLEHECLEVTDSGDASAHLVGKVVLWQGDRRCLLGVQVDLQRALHHVKVEQVLVGMLERQTLDLDEALAVGGLEPV